MGIFPRRCFYQVHLPGKILWKLTRRSTICFRSYKVIFFYEILLKFCSLAMLGLPEIPKTYGEEGFRGIFYFFIASQVAMIAFPIILGRKLKIMKKET